MMILIFTALIAALTSALGGFIVVAATVTAIFNHAGDLGVLRAYSGVVVAQEQKVTELRAVLKERFAITEVDAKVLLNADSPVKSAVESLTEATTALAAARISIALAAVKIEQRKAGPMCWR